MAIDNELNIINRLSQEFNIATKERKKQIINVWISNLNSSIERLKTLSQKNIQYDWYWVKVYQMKYAIPLESAIEQAFIEGMIEVNLKTAAKELMDSMLNLYEATLKIRKSLTGQEIFYQIAVSTQSKKNGNNILEGRIPFSKLRNALYLEQQGNEYSIRIRNSQKFLKENAQEQDREEKEAIDFIQNYVSSGSTLYSEVYRYKTTESLNKGRATGNWGNAYEAYRYLYNRSRTRPRNKWKPGADTIAKAFREVLGGGGISGSYLHGGDSTFFEQDKFGQATLTSVTTLINQGEKLKQALNSFIETDSIIELKNLLIRKQAGSKILNEAVKDAEEYLKKILQVNYKN